MQATIYISVSLYRDQYAFASSRSGIWRFRGTAQKIQKYVKKNGESFDLEVLKKEVNKSKIKKTNDVQNLYAQLGLELKLPDEHILRDDNNILYKHTFMLNLRKEVDIFACNAI